MRLDDAIALHVGATPVLRVHVGAEQVWPTGAPGVEYARWGASHNATLADDNRTLRWGGGAFECGYAVSDAVLVGRQRWQVRYHQDFAATPPTEDYYTAAGVWSRLDEQYWGGAEIFHSNTYSPAQPAAGISPAPWYAANITNGDWGSGGDFPDDPGVEFIWEFCSEVVFSGGIYTMRVWARHVLDDGADIGNWIEGGDPVAGTSPSLELTATNPFRIGGSVFYSPGSRVTLLHPDDYTVTPTVAGYATGVTA